MYDHTKQYRCTIIRGKSQKEMDDLLPAYAKVVNEICPCLHDDFEQLFNRAFERFLSEYDKEDSERKKKTLDNHRTEISGKLFGMYYFSEDGMVYESERTTKYLIDNDQPAFFKDICYKMQFPNGTQKIATTVLERVRNNISVRPNAFILKLLQIAQTAKITITKKELGYYVLNSLDVLQGNASPYEVLEAISKDQKLNIQRDIIVEGKASSYSWQHINEQLNYLELANLIRITNDKKVILNPKEMNTINLFIEDFNKLPEFNVYKYNLTNINERKQFQYDWDVYFAKLSTKADQFATKLEALEFNINKEPIAKEHKKTSTINLVEMGDEGENIVYEYEKNRVAKFNPRLVNKVLSLGKTKGIGYDIQSVVAENGTEAEFVKYIEVKTTKRFTCPSLDDNLWIDTLNVTRNEWIAAHQHKDYYSIFRVYLTREGAIIFVIKNVADKIKEGIIQATPTTYRFDISNTSIDESIQLYKEVVNV